MKSVTDSLNVTKLCREYVDRLEHLRTVCQDTDDRFVWCTLALALTSTMEGNHGVGAIIAHNEQILAEGRNRAFFPKWDSGLHAEMDAVNHFEDLPDSPPAGECTLYTSVECCPMCTVRLVNAGIGRVVYVAEDDDCGMLRRFDQLPPGYVNLSRSRTPPQRFEPYTGLPELRVLARDVFGINSSRLDQETLARPLTPIR